jgi:3-isopropylmalate/(R)-2-methylmalate dehydratase small subunit
MAQFTALTSRLLPLLVDDIDTDQIIPARFLKVTHKNGLGGHLFADWRYDASGSPRLDFVLNHPLYQGAQVLLAGDNFGCGSSREHAPWALLDYGFRAVLSTSFADIFCNNSLKNGLLPVVLEAEAHRDLARQVMEDPELEITIDLAAQQVLLPGGERVSFPIDAFSKSCLLKGMDEMEYLLSFEEQIKAYEALHLSR